MIFLESFNLEKCAMKRLIYLLLSLLGLPLASCENWGLVGEYGTPYVNFSVKARVVDEEGDPIKGIQAQIVKSYVNSKAYSDEKGNILLRTNQLWDIDDVTLRFEDVDGPDNGGWFNTQEFIVDEDDIVQTGKPKGDWHEGDFELNVGDVSMSQSKCGM